MGQAEVQADIFMQSCVLLPPQNTVTGCHQKRKRFTTDKVHKGVWIKEVTGVQIAASLDGNHNSQTGFINEGSSTHCCIR